MSDAGEFETTAWDMEAEGFSQALGWSEADARDYIIEKRLVLSGDTKPFLDWVLRCGHEPSRRVIEIIAQMMAKTHGVPLAENETPKFGLKVDHPSHGRRNLDTDVRDYHLGKMSSNHMDAGKTGKEADWLTYQFALQAGFNISEATVHQARIRFRKARATTG